ncbi:MAG: sugar transferase [Cytophagales bacterium]|nr:sugar transferase [Cytophagales bacterium]
MNQFYSIVGKRAFDLLLVVFLMVLFSWLLVLITIGYIITIEFPVLFKSWRMGKAGVPFTMLKFRTLSGNENLPLDKRRFALGTLLRLTNFDELPQLWNVLKGEMSFVGPRPLPVEYSLLFSQEQKRRHDVLPGITGWAQVCGKNDISWQEKFELDLYYVNHVSFLMDVKVLVKTFILVFSFKKDTSLSEKKFTG